MEITKVPPLHCQWGHSVSTAVWLIMVCLAGGLAGGLWLNWVVKSAACSDVQGIQGPVCSSASHLVNSFNESDLFLGGLFFIRGVRGRSPRLGVCRLSGPVLEEHGWGEGLESGAWGTEGVGSENIQGLVGSILMSCFLCVQLLLEAEFPPHCSEVCPPELDSYLSVENLFYRSLYLLIM